MKRWTPEAEQRLDSYLDEVLDLARKSGEADDDFVDELRMHIRSDAEESAGGVVTPQNLERALAAAGRPHDVLGIDIQPRPLTLASGNGNGHSALAGTVFQPVLQTDGCGVSHEGNSGGAAFPRIRVILGGILLPLIAIAMEFLLLSVSGGGGVGVMPTVMHVVLLGAVPVLFMLLLIRADRQSDMTRPFDRRCVALTTGYLLSISALYSIFMLPVAPFSLLAIIYLGVGLIGLSPFISLFCALLVNRTFKERGLYAAPHRGSSLAWCIAGGLLAAVPLLWNGGLELARNSQARAVLRGNQNEQARAIAWLRVIGLPDPSSGWRRDENLASLWHDWLYSNSSHGDLSLERDEIAELSFRLSGEVLSTESISSWYTTNLFSRRLQILEQQGRSEVGLMIPGLSLAHSTVHVDLVSDGLAESALSYTEWVLEFSNDNSEANEARCVIAMPPGSVASRLTLWINGVECEAAFGGVSQVKAAYQDVAIARMQDPALLTNPAKGEVFLQCFPVPARGTMKVRLGISAPLQSIENKTYLSLPRLSGQNFQIPEGFAHQIMVESARAIGTEIPGLTPVAHADGSYSMAGRILHGELSDVSRLPLFTLDGDLPQSLYQGRLGPYYATIDTKHAAPILSRNVWLVVDGSAGVGNAKIDWAALVRAFPEDATLHGTFAHFRTETWDGLGGREGLIAWLESREFGFGQRLAPALHDVINSAAGAANSEVLVIHGPQPFEDEYDEALLAALRMSRRNGGNLPVRMVAAAAGPNVLAKALVNFGEVEPVPIYTTLQEAMEHLARTGAPTDIRRTFTLTRVDDAPASSDLHGTASHVVRLAALDRVMELLRSESPIETQEAITIAKRCRLVTPVSGAVVLENQAQYQRHGLDDKDSLDAVPAVPEPEEWLLIVVGGFAVGVAWSRRKKLRSAVMV